MHEYVSPIIITGAVTWLLAQAIKVALKKLKGKDKKRFSISLSGGMPSAHSAVVASVMLLVALTEGFNSPLFAVVVLFGSIVIYDSVKLRRSSGQQGDAILAIIKESKSKIKPPTVAHGHTLIEALVGVALGALIATVSYFVFYP